MIEQRVLFREVDEPESVRHTRHHALSREIKPLCVTLQGWGRLKEGLGKIYDVSRRIRKGKGNGKILIWRDEGKK